MNPFEMVVMIVAIAMIGSIIKTRIQTRHGIITDNKGNEQFVGQADNGDAALMREEIKQLKERIIVLERVITDTNSATALDREIEKLR